MRKDRYDWKKQVIIDLGNPNYKGAFSLMWEKGPEGKWKVSGLELHIYDAGEKSPPARPNGIHRGNVVDPTRNMSRTIEGTSDTGNNFTDAPIHNQRTKTPADRNGTLFSVLEPPESMTERNHVPTAQERNSVQQPAPQFYSPATPATNRASISAVQSKKHVSDHKGSVSSTSFVTIAPFGTSPKAHQLRTVAPMRPYRNTLLPEEPVVSSANISAPLIKSESESDAILSPPSGSPEAVSTRLPSGTATQSEPSHSLSHIEFDSSFCSGSNAVESLCEIASGFLRRYVCTAPPFASLTSQRFFGYWDSTEKARISGGVLGRSNDVLAVERPPFCRCLPAGRDSTSSGASDH